jgi:hypothetical protein
MPWREDPVCVQKATGDVLPLSMAITYETAPVGSAPPSGGNASSRGFQAQDHQHAPEAERHGQLQDQWKGARGRPPRHECRGFHLCSALAH